MAQVWFEPAAIERALRPDANATAPSESPISPAPSPMVAVEPMPNWPYVPRPQHLTEKLSSNAHECCEPTVICSAVRPVPSDTAGSESPICPVESPLLAVLPYPSAPTAPYPQHLIVALSSNAHVCDAPAAIERTVRPVPSATALEVATLKPVPSPMLSVLPLPN